MNLAGQGSARPGAQIEAGLERAQKQRLQGFEGARRARLISSCLDLAGRAARRWLRVASGRLVLWRYAPETHGAVFLRSSYDQVYFRHRHMKRVLICGTQIRVYIYDANNIQDRDYVRAVRGTEVTYINAKLAAGGAYCTELCENARAMAWQPPWSADDGDFPGTDGEWMWVASRRRVRPCSSAVHARIERLRPLIYHDELTIDLAILEAGVHSRQADKQIYLRYYVTKSKMGLRAACAGHRGHLYDNQCGIRCGVRMVQKCENARGMGLSYVERMRI